MKILKITVDFTTPNYKKDFLQIIAVPKAQSVQFSFNALRSPVQTLEHLKSNCEKKNDIVVQILGMFFLCAKNSKNK